MKGIEVSIYSIKNSLIWICLLRNFEFTLSLWFFRNLNSIFLRFIWTVKFTNSSYKNTHVTFWNQCGHFLINKWLRTKQNNSSFFFILYIDDFGFNKMFSIKLKGLMENDFLFSMKQHHRIEFRNSWTFC